MQPRAYLVQHGRTEAVTLDPAKAVDYAARNHGTISPLVLRVDALKLQAKLVQLRQVVTTDHETKDAFIARMRAILES